MTLVIRKRYSAAVKLAQGAPIVRLGMGKDALYIVGMHALDEVSVIDSEGTIAGNVTLRHLQRLGNANWAEARRKYPYDQNQG